MSPKVARYKISFQKSIVFLYISSKEFGKYLKGIIYFINKRNVFERH